MYASGGIVRKKYSFFAVCILCAIVSQRAYAGSCQPVSCSEEYDSSEMLTLKGETKIDGKNLLGQNCYICDADEAGGKECDYKVMVFTMTGGIKVHYCNNDAGIDDSWEPASINFCSDSELQTDDPDANAEEKYLADNGKKVTGNHGSIKNPCWMRKCKTGYKSDDYKTKCIEDSSAGCAKGNMPGIDTEPTYKEGTESEKYSCERYNIGSDPNKDTCFSKCYKEEDGYVWHSHIATCKNNMVPNSNGDECVEKGSGGSNSGGSNSSGSNSNGSNPGSSGTKTTTKPEKPKFGGYTSTVGIACWKLGKKVAKYDEKEESCTCLDKKTHFVLFASDQSGACISNDLKFENTKDGDENDAKTPREPTPYEQCQKLIDRNIPVAWNAAKSACVCEDANYELNAAGNRCVKTAAYIARQDAEKAEQRKESRPKIIAAGRELNKIASTFETSVWKNRDGGFNTARLASDGVAGVVVGTVGGLITSNVIKKNQIESGFENLKCAIGGQTVADYGDDFDVGIR